MSSFTQQLTHTIIPPNEVKGKTEHSKLDPGMAADFMCSSFEGDRKDLNEANTPELHKIMGDFFS